mgnify:CR=1 FL=1
MSQFNTLKLDKSITDQYKLILMQQMAKRRSNPNYQEKKISQKRMGTIKSNKFFEF